MEKQFSAIFARDLPLDFFEFVYPVDFGRNCVRTMPTSYQLCTLRLLTVDSLAIQPASDECNRSPINSSARRYFTKSNKVISIHAVLHTVRNMAIRIRRFICAHDYCVDGFLAILRFSHIFADAAAAVLYARNSRHRH